MLERLREGVRYLLGVLLFGSLWGALEATLGGLLALIRFPHFGGTMANVGFLTMATAVALHGKPGMALGIGLVAASFKLLSVPIFGVSPLAKMIINPMIAIVLEALAFTLVVGLVLRRWPRNLLAQAGAGVGAMWLVYLGELFSFFYITQRVPRFILADPWGWVLTSGGFAAGLALVSVPLGGLLGRLLLRVKRAAEPRPALYYAGVIGLILLCIAAAIWGTLTLG